MNGRQTEHNEVLLQLLRCEGRTDVKHLNGLNTYDYGARQYDPARITWDRMDQFCEKYYHINPYVYCGGNPVNRIDPDGMDWYSSLDSVGCINGRTIWETQIHYTECTSQKQLKENNIEESMSASRNFDLLVGGSYPYINRNNGREATKFLFPITDKLILKSRIKWTY